MSANAAVLVLNENYEPLNVTNARRALVLLDRGKAEVLEHSAAVIRSASRSLYAPSVIRLVYMIKRPRPQVRLSRREVFLRDNYTCQYCGVKTRDLTLDHVLPRQRGGRHSWDNLVSACKACNHRKGNRTPDEARMHLHRAPHRPRSSGYYIFAPYLQSQQGWRKFIADWIHGPD
ncbi:MAG: HNH endonuclease [Dehalococcoidia bacterium]|nr:HNH endonuclease [Dehalococcoidia bacterium]